MKEMSFFGSCIHDTFFLLFSCISKSITHLLVLEEQYSGCLLAPDEDIIGGSLNTLRTSHLRTGKSMIQFYLCLLFLLSWRWCKLLLQKVEKGSYKTCENLRHMPSQFPKSCWKTSTSQWSLKGAEEEDQYLSK